MYEYRVEVFGFGKKREWRKDDRAGYDAFAQWLTDFSRDGWELVPLPFEPSGMSMAIWVLLRREVAS